MKTNFFNAKVVGILRNNVCLEWTAYKQINKSGGTSIKKSASLKGAIFPNKQDKTAIED